MTNLPYHQSERCFRKYEGIIGTIVGQLPGLTIIQCPDNVSINTFVARLRDSISSVRKYNWKTLVFEQSKLLLYPTLTVCVKDDKIVCGIRRSIKESVIKQFATKVIRHKDSEEFDAGSLVYENIQFLAHLFSNNILSSPITFTCLDRQHPADILTLEDDFDLTIIKNENGSFTMS